MGAFALALEKLADVSVSGVTSYSLDALPESLAAAQLPALVILPEWGGVAPGLTPSAFSAGDGTLVVRVVHALLVLPVMAGPGLRGALPDLVALADAYLAALAADPLLDGSLPVALRCDVDFDVIRYAGIDYHGARFTHTWTLHLAAS